MSADTATIGHNSVAVGEMIAADPTVIFREAELVESLFEEIKTSLSEQEPDTTTDKGRKAIASKAFAIAKQKTAIDNAGKGLTEEYRKKTGEINDVRKTVRDTLDDLRDQARAPLTAWEAEEKRKSDLVDQARLDFQNAIKMAPTYDAERVADAKQCIAAIELDAAVFGPMLEIAETEKQEALAALVAASIRIEKEEAERKELEALRAEKAAKEEAERVAAAKAAAEKAEQARIDEAKAAEADRVKREEQAKAQAAIDAANKEREAAQAQLKAQEEEQERQRQAKLAEERAEFERQKDKSHRNLITACAAEAMVDEAGITDEQAKKIVTAILADLIPNVYLRF